MASTRLTKAMRVSIYEAFKQGIHEQVSSTNGEKTTKELDAIAFRAIRDSFLGDYKEAFDSIPASAKILPVSTAISIGFNEPPLAHLRPANSKGGEARMYRQTWFAVAVDEGMTVPDSVECRSVSFDELPKSVQNKVMKAITQSSKYEREMNTLQSTFLSLLTQCTTIKSLKERWPGVEKYLPEGIDQPGKAIGVTAAEIEAQIDRVMKAAA